MCDAAVLVVEDEEPQLGLIVGILGRSGYRVDAARSVDEALRRIECSIPDVVLCDWRMPVGHPGTSVVVRHIRSRSESNHCRQLATSDEYAEPLELGRSQWY